MSAFVYRINAPLLLLISHINTLVYNYVVVSLKKKSYLHIITITGTIV